MKASVDSLEPGDQILVDGKAGEFIRKDSVGELQYLRVYIQGKGVKTICTQDVSIEKKQSPVDKLDLSTYEFNPRDGPLSAKRFDLRSQAIRLKLAYTQRKLLSISNSLVRLEPYQLACVNKVMRNLRQRFLIADDVGLGKTIEAGLIFKELKVRKRADRVLIIVPAHLQKKWIRDMKRFFDIDLIIADRIWVEGERRRLGEGTNIWGQENLQLLTSMAFLRQDEFKESLKDVFWDLVIVDEAHKGSKRGDSPSKRARLIERVAERSDALLLLTATPHDGKEKPFRSLIEYIDPFIAAPNENLDKNSVERVMIRRGKNTIYDDNGERIFPDRKVRTIPVNMSRQERVFYNAVTEYVRRIYNRSEKLNEPAVGFAMAIMQKRLVSSIGAIRETLRRRLRNLLEVGSTELSSEAEAYLDGNDLDELDKEKAEQELERLTIPESDEELEQEIIRLQELIKMVDSLPLDSKALKVSRFIHQLLEEEPNEKLLMFTEYKDTLEYLINDVLVNEPWSNEILVIHGGVSREERDRIEKEFNYGRSRLLLATDAASEGIDLQHSCHIMVNYELPWNPNRLEQRIGRIHRYGQEKEVKVWNFQFEGTRESEIFNLLNEKIDNIRNYIGTTADMIGILENLDIQSIIMNSIRSHKPPSATREEFEKIIEKRKQTLLEWYDRSPLDPTTFDMESRQRMRRIINESKDVFGKEEDLRDFFIESIRIFGGEVRQKRYGVYELKIPEKIKELFNERKIGPITFDRKLAMQNRDLKYISPDSEIISLLIKQILDEEELFGGIIGLKVLPFVDNPGITYNYHVIFEDGEGEIVREELIPVFVEAKSKDAQKVLGVKAVNGESILSIPNSSQVSKLMKQENELRKSAEQYLSKIIKNMREELKTQRNKETIQELDKLREYSKAENNRIQEFLNSYEKQAEKGSDMKIAIRSQRSRLKNIEQRIQERKDKLENKTRIISLAPEIKNYCLTFPL